MRFFKHTTKCHANLKCALAISAQHLIAQIINGKLPCFAFLMTTISAMMAGMFFFRANHSIVTLHISNLETVFCLIMVNKE